MTLSVCDDLCTRRFGVNFAKAEWPSAGDGGQASSLEATVFALAGGPLRSTPRLQEVFKKT